MLHYLVHSLLSFRRFAQAGDSHKQGHSLVLTYQLNYKLILLGIIVKFDVPGGKAFTNRKTLLRQLIK